MPDPIIAIVNASDIISNADLSQYCQDIQTQIDHDFYPIWGKRADVTFTPRHGHPPAGSWPIYINRHSDDPDALGWHSGETYIHHGPDLRRRLSLCRHLRLRRSLPRSPRNARRSRLSPNHDSPDGRLAALEMCDPVEADSYGYVVGKTLVSDFILPPYFHPGAGAFGSTSHQS
jgi:hypothetical protein